MRLAMPAVLWSVLAAALAVAALHLLSWRRPVPRWLPTARFIPSGIQRAVSRRIEPSDLGLLALRVLALAAAGLAIAGPMLAVTRPGVARVIVADRSRAVASLGEVRDSVRQLVNASATARVLLFDSLPVPASEAAWRDTTGLDRRGDLDAALIVASREAAALRSEYDSVVVAVVSPLHAEQTSAATGAIVAAGRVPVELVRVASRATEAAPQLPSAAWPEAADPLGAALRRAVGTVPPWLRVSRAGLDAQDSVHAAQGGLVLHWPRLASDSPITDGLVSRSGAVVGALGRGEGEPQGMPVAWWSDGRPAAWQYRLASGCIRVVDVALPAAGDAVLRPAFLRVVRDLVAPCAWRDDRAVAAIGSTAGPAPRGAEGVISPLVRRLLLLLALAALGVEWVLRRRRERGAPGGVLAAGGSA